MNPVICSVVAYCFVILAMNSVTGRPGRELVTTICSFRNGSASSLNGLSQQDLNGFIFRGAGWLDGLSPQDLKDLDSWSSSPGIFDGLNPQQLQGLICPSAGEAGNLKHQIERTPYIFEYEHQDVLQMDISFKLPSDVTGGFVSLRYSSRDHHPKNTFEIRRPNDENDDPVVHVRDIVSDKRVYIDVQLFNKTGLCIYERISEGNIVKKSLNSSDTDYAYSPICLNGNRCQIKVDLKKEYEDTEVSKKPTCNFVLCICLPIFAIALCVLLIAAFIKCCWIKRDAPVPLQPKNPFYVNLLFRKECQEIIDDLERNHYELID